ncbi:Ankyrin repeats (3 copies) [Phytophthora infestans]|uniref:Ankyrin repeats (3 copies) n=1 Tax=Phytophthora infestans TaxID=4787 RepID=A0A833SRZ3_PHYIN|nr:Ankyrin repeats (3 copies) [Phytophthora infestans]
MSWLQTHEVAIPFYEIRAGKQVFAIQVQERPLRQEQLASNWSNITSSSSQCLLDEDGENSSVTGNTSGVCVAAMRSYSQFRKLWRDLIRATKTPSTASLSRSNSADLAHSGHSSNCRLANSFHSLSIDGESSSSCRCRNWNCTFRNLHYFLKTYPFPSKLLIKRHTASVLETRRQGLELFITTVRGLFDTFPRPFLQSIDELGTCQVMKALNAFFDINAEHHVNLLPQSLSQTTLKIPPLKCAERGRCRSVSDNTTCFSSSTVSGRSIRSSNNAHAEEDPLCNSGVDYYLREDDLIPNTQKTSNPDFEPQEQLKVNEKVDQTLDKCPTSPHQAGNSPKNSTGRRSRYYRGMSIRSHTAFLARNPTMPYRRGSATSMVVTPQTLLPGLPKLKLPNAEVSSIRSFLEEFRDHLLLDSQALGNSSTPIEWNEDRQWELALYVASQIGHAYAVESILYRGTSPNVVMEDGLSSLHAACRGGHRSIVAMLLTHGADTNITDPNGVSPLLAAVQLGDLEIVEMLVEYGADVNLCNKDNVSAVHVAVASQTFPVLQLLLECDAFVNTTNTFNGKTPLHLAAQTGSLPTCKLLLNYGANIHHKTTRGLDVVALAKTHGHENIARFCLLSYSNQKHEQAQATHTADEVQFVCEDGYAYAVL